MKKQNELKMAELMVEAQDMFIGQINQPFEFGTETANVHLENFIVNALFPKMKAQHSVTNDLRNKFSRFVKLVPSAGEIIEVYGLLDMTPVDLGLDESGLELFKNNFAQVVALQYTNQVAKKAKLTLELKETRKRFTTGGSALIDYVAVNEATLLNGIARTEQEEMLQMFVQYYREKTLVNQEVESADQVAVGIATQIMNIQDNVKDYNQVSQISAEYANADYTTSTDLEDVFILTTNNISARISTDIFPQYFDTEGIDFRDRIISVREFPQIVTTLKDYTLTAEDIKLLSAINYLIKEGTVIKKGTLIPNNWYTKGVGKGEEGLFEVYSFGKDQNLAFIFDKQAILYAWDEGAGYTPPFQNPENLTIQMYYHYTTLKAIVPFFNIGTVSVGKAPDKTVTP